MNPAPELQGVADDRLSAALAETGAEDPRGPCRRLLRGLKESDEALYAKALERFEETVRAIATNASDPLDAWLAYALHLAQSLDPGAHLVVDPTGRAAPLATACWRDLILHVPEDPKRRALLVNTPPEPSAAQIATVDLLVHGKLRLG